MDKCYVELVGGLGNQLFQIANGFAYSKTYDKELVIATHQWVAHQGRNPLIYKDTVFSNFNFGNQSGNYTVLAESYSPLNYVEGDVSLNGYFQSMIYFEKFKDEFISLLTFPEVDLSFIQPKNVAFHIRRGDYLIFKDMHLFCGTRYFKHEFERFKDYQINVFTDSPDIVLNEFNGHEFNIVKSNSSYPELSEMVMMSRHNNFVGSNSSFSWWASLMGNKKETVIFPNKWITIPQQLNEQIYLLRPDMTLSDQIL